MDSHFLEARQMKATYLLCIGFAALAALLAAGCTPSSAEPTTGTIVPSPRAFGVGSHAPDATFVDHKGRVRTVSRLFEDATLLAFVPGRCPGPAAELAAAAAKLRGRAAVIQVCIGTCDTDASCVQRNERQARNMVYLCDGQHYLSRRYGVFDEKALFVIDQYATIVSRGHLANLETLRRKTQELADEAQREREYYYGAN
jgi:peroxiredoxin